MEETWSGKSSLRIVWDYCKPFPIFILLSFVNLQNVIIIFTSFTLSYQFQMATVTWHSFILLQSPEVCSYSTVISLQTKSLNTVKACSVNSGLKNLGYCLLCLDLTPLWHVHEHCGIETSWSGKTDRGQETEIRSRTAKTDAVGGGVNPVGEWVIMSVHPAVAPSGATGLAGSLMRHHCRLLLEKSLTQQFLSASGTVNQVGGEAEKRARQAAGVG